MNLPGILVVYICLGVSEFIEDRLTCNLDIIAEIAVIYDLFNVPQVSFDVVFLCMNEESGSGDSFPGSSLGFQGES